MPQRLRWKQSFLGCCGSRNGLSIASFVLMSPPSETDANPSSADDLLAAPATHRFSMADMTPQELYEAIHAVPVSASDEKLTQIELTGADGQHNALMRLHHSVRVNVDGPLGDYAFAFNAEADVRVTGAVGSGVGEGMISGAVRIRACRNRP